MVDKVALGQVVSEYFGFPCQFSFHRLLRTHPSIGAGTIGLIVADVPSGHSLTPPHELRKTAIRTAQGLAPITLHGPHYSYNNADRLATSVVFRSEEEHGIFMCP
jgi:hypothetical protein